MKKLSRKSRIDILEAWNSKTTLTWMSCTWMDDCRPATHREIKELYGSGSHSVNNMYLKAVKHNSPK
jgi:hypothetical protein